MSSLLLPLLLERLNRKFEDGIEGQNQIERRWTDVVEGENNLERRLCVGMNELPRDQNSLVHRIEPETVDPRRSTRLLGRQLDYRFPARHTLRSETVASPKE